MVIRTLLFIITLIVFSASSSASWACSYPSEWHRSLEPVFRDKIDGENYEVASDPHVFPIGSGENAMIYSGDDQGNISIKLAKTVDSGAWAFSRVLIGETTGHPVPLNKETPFYRLSESGEHQIYFIGYDDEETYQAQVYLAVSKALEGPYTIAPIPIVQRGSLAGKNVHLITSPSVVEHEGRLWMVFLAWNGFEDVTEVWSMGAISDDNGRTWSSVRELDIPIGMEGQLTKTPDNRFVATNTGEFQSAEAIFMSCAEHPFGPYQTQKLPILEPKGAPWEVDEIIAPQISFDAETNLPTLFYTGADHARGWWIMSATPNQN